MPKLNKTERAALENFRDLNITLEELGREAKRRVSFNFVPTALHLREIQKHTAPAVPAVIVSRQHLVAAYLRWKSGAISTKGLSDWAAMIIMNDDFELLPDESELLAEWLNQVMDGKITSPNPC